MKTIIAGSRNFNDYHELVVAMNQVEWEVTEVFSGGARGVDRLGERWAKANDIPLKKYLADWEGNGKSAGPIRNAEMARDADALVALWDGISKGTKNMIEQARKRKLLVFVWDVESCGGIE